jgi:hypothetical protein
MVNLTSAAAQFLRYQEGLNEADSYPLVVELLTSQMDPGYVRGRPLDVTQSMRLPEDFEEWRAGLARERMGLDNTDQWLDRYGDLLFPPAFAAFWKIERGEWRPEMGLSD